METDIITALRKQLFNIVDSDEENVKFFTPGEGCNMKISFNGQTWELEEVEPNIDGELPPHAKSEADKFTKAFEEEKNKLDKENNLRKLAEMERVEQQIREVDENRTRDAERKEKTYEHKRPFQKSNLDPIKPSNTKTPLLDMVYDYTGNDVLEIFGETGSGKSKLSMEIAKQGLAAGKKVFYLDTERNITKKDMEELNGCTYKYTPVLDEIDKTCQNLPACDIVIVDSIGFPILTTFARMSMKQKGDALLKLIAIFGDLKTWAYKNNGIVIVTNQPESDFNKAPGHVLRPFGDKSQFAAKEILKTEIVDRRPDCTKIKLSAFRSRSVGHGTKIADVRISSEGVETSF